jgi:hypothetical protein
MDRWKNIVFEYRYSEGNNDRLPALIADLIRLKVDIIVTSVTNDTLAANAGNGQSPPPARGACHRAGHFGPDPLARHLPRPRGRKEVSHASP